MHDAMRTTHTPHIVDNADWLKTGAIILVAVGHFGYFFIDYADWWSVLGRMAAPVFFFLMGYARSRTIPLRWIWLGVILTLLDSWNMDWTWVAPNILISMVLIRSARPYVKILMERYGWIAFTVSVLALLAMLPIAANLVDYGAEGWLWALFGLCQRMYIDGKSTTNVSMMRWPACIVAAVVYVWQEQVEFWFSQNQLTAVMFGVGILALGLCFFRRGPSPVQPPAFIASVLHFVGWHTLEIYVIQLAGSELIIKFLPDLAA